MDSSSKDTLLIMYYPQIEKMKEITHDLDGTEEDLLTWFGVAFEEMLLLPFEKPIVHREVASRLDNRLRVFRECIYSNTRLGVMEIPVSSIREIKMLADGSIVIRLRKDKYDKKIHSGVGLVSTRVPYVYKKKLPTT